MADQVLLDQEPPTVHEIDIPDLLPLLPLRDIVVFPHMVIPLFVGREMSIRAIERALSTDRLMFLVAQRSRELEAPKPDDIHTIGTCVTIMRMLKLPDERIKILVQGLVKAEIVEYVQDDPFYQVKIAKLIDPSMTDSHAIETEAAMRTVKEKLEQIASFGKGITPDMIAVIESIEEPGRLADMATANLGLKVDGTQEILEILDPILRLKRVSELLGKEIKLLSMQQKIHAEAKGEIDKTQREYFLREQLKAIQKELGELDERAEEIHEFKQRINAAAMPEHVLKETEKQLKRLEKMHPDTAEAATVRTYLEWMVDIPWSTSTKDRLDLKTATTMLDEDHYNLEKVKERILEYLAVRRLKANMKGPILCFVGPPGVGKTSLGKSIARVLGREFVRISLGGVRDEAEIRGHRRTYVGALPGRIIQGLKQAKSNNPVFMLDEIDKVGADFRGDPSAALLEVLDPEQNHSFSDHYVGVFIDLSNVMFITTANLIDPILPALRDRMETIQISGYSQEEKIGIAKRFLVPRQLHEHGITKKHIKISDAALRNIIAHYTREAGVRNLERTLATLMRKVARNLASGRRKLHSVSPSVLHEYLGAPKFSLESDRKKGEVGVATGLAWTETGGEILQVEATLMKGKGTLTLTGQLGDVMKESAQAALSYVRSRGNHFGLEEEIFSKIDIHLHVPAGAIPKDGPSAGITLASALTSALTNTPVRHNTAMTGEVTLRGRVLPVGGLKEKLLAARREKVSRVIVPKRNQKDFEDIPSHLLRGMHVVFAETMDDVIHASLNSMKLRPPIRTHGATKTV